MIAVLGGLGAAVAWAATMLTASRASPLIGSWSTLAWVMLTGLLVVGPVALAQGRPEGLDRGAMTWLAIAGFGNITGLLLVYTALRIGKVGVIAPLSSTEGAVAAIIAVAAGETLGAWTALALLVVAVGVSSLHVPPRSRTRRGTTIRVRPCSRSRRRSHSARASTPPAAPASTCRSPGRFCPRAFSASSS